MRSFVKNALLSSIFAFNLSIIASESFAQIPDDIPGAQTVYDANVIRQLIILGADANANFGDVRNKLGAVQAHALNIRNNTINMLNRLISINTGIAAINTNIAAIATSNINTSTDIAAIRVNTNNTAINTSNLAAGIGTIATNTGNTSNNTSTIATDTGAIAVNTNQTALNTNDIKASLLNIDPNTLNISNQINNLAIWLKELRDFFLGIPTGVPSNFPWFDDPVEQRYRERDSPFEVLFTKFKLGQYLDSPVLDTTVHALITRYSIDDALVISTTGSPADIQAETATAGLATSSLLSSGIAERAYYRAGLSMVRIQAYLTDLQTSASLKHSIDLNTRVMIELTQTNNEILRTISAYSIMQGAVVMTGNTDIETETAP